uniref:Uncharacterized protein n=1 Tax=Bionectria ochroleuca TaxID=29856 RepID=A0A8H7TLG7_BIOOC
MERSRGIPDKEMFLKQDAPDNDPDSPTIEPLRIFKPQSPTPVEKHSAYHYPAPPSSTSPPSRPSFPLPPGASSSAAPLPFPVDDDVRRPTPLQSYGSSYNDTSPRIESPTDKKPGLAERRGTAPKPISSPISSPTSPGADQDLFARPLQQQPRPAASSVDYPTYQNQTYYPPLGLHHILHSNNTNSRRMASKDHLKVASTDLPPPHRYLRREQVAVPPTSRNTNR